MDIVNNQAGTHPYLIPLLAHKNRHR